MDSYSFKRKWREQKDMGLKLVSKTDVISLSGVIYPYVSKRFSTTDKTFSN